jgi:hypothetical protein
MLQPPFCLPISLAASQKKSFCVHIKMRVFYKPAHWMDGTSLLRPPLKNEKNIDSGELLYCFLVSSSTWHWVSFLTLSSFLFCRLVDCHKASYVPICLAGVDNFLTAEPAVVVPTSNDTDALSMQISSSIPSASSSRPSAIHSTAFSLGSSQLGATFRRMSTFRPNPIQGATYA